jgi:hypothetical protein
VARALPIDVGHVTSGHTAGGSRVSPLKDLFPPGMSDAQIEKAIRDAYANGKKVATQGDRVKVVGQWGRCVIVMWVNVKTKNIETAFPNC